MSILDVASLKPDGDKFDDYSQDANKSSKGIFSNSTPVVARQCEVSGSPNKFFSPNERDYGYKTSWRGLCRSKDCHLTSNTQHQDSPTNCELNSRCDISSPCESKHDSSEICLIQNSQRPKRKGDLEFELQMEMALSSTAVGIADSKIQSQTDYSDNNLSNFSSPLKRMKKIASEESSSSNVISTAIGSKRIGSPLFWAEVYCNGENLTGKWMHVDALNVIIDGEQKVEAVAAACKTSLRYVVAFAGNGAKDVTRRF